MKTRHAPAEEHIEGSTSSAAHCSMHGCVILSGTGQQGLKDLKALHESVTARAVYKQHDLFHIILVPGCCWLVA